jgi:indolepyruvate ferredoxin oxidoreductase
MAHPYTHDLTLILAVAVAVAIVRIPEDICGYGYVKERHLATACPRWAALMERWRNPAATAHSTAPRQAA